MTASTIDTPRAEDAYARQFAQLLPRGAAWAFAPDGPMARLLFALASEYARIDSRALDLREEADPRTALELLPDWERVAALPDTCTGAPDEVSERQAALHQKLAGVGGQNRAAFVEIAARLGYEVVIDEHRPARIGSRCQDQINGQDWAFAWTARVRPFEGYLSESTFLAVAEIGDRVGVRLRGFGALDVECVIRRAAPAHTHVLFAYEVEPEPGFWFDFTA